VDGKRGLVDRSIALYDRTLFIDHDQIRHTDMCEVHAEGIDPEVICQLGIADGDVAGDSFHESEFRKQAECGCQALFAMQPFLTSRLERGHGGRLGNFHF
jgi:hypothetical protein